MSLILESDYDIRYSRAEDLEFLKQWMADPQTHMWYPPSSEKDVRQFVQNWIGFSKYRASITAIYQNQPIGIATVFLMPYLKVAHLCMMYIVVAPKWRRRGVGGSLLKNVKHLAKTRFRLESMHIEVWEGCPIIELSKRYGFEEIFTQEDFVHMDGKSYSRIVLETKL